MLCVVMAFSSSSNCPVFFNFFTRLLTAFSHHFSSCPFSSPFFQPRSLFTIGGVNGNMDILNEHRPLIPPFHPEEQATRPLNVPASETPRQTMAGRRRGSSGLRRRIPQTELDACREWCGSPDRPTDRPGGASFGPAPAARSAGAPSTCRHCRQITHDTEKCTPLVPAAPSGCVRSAPQSLPISDIPFICKDCYLLRQPLFCAPPDPRPPTTSLWKQSACFIKYVAGLWIHSIIVVSYPSEPSHWSYF